MSGYYIITPANHTATVILERKFNMSRLVYTPNKFNDSDTIPEDLNKFLIELFGHQLAQIENWNIEKMTISH